MSVEVEKELKKAVDKSEIFDRSRWGIPRGSAKKVVRDFKKFFEKYCNCFKTATWNNSHYAYEYMSGLIVMDAKRNFANISRTMVNYRDSGRNLQQFMSNSFRVLYWRCRLWSLRRSQVWVE